MDVFHKNQNGDDIKFYELKQFEYNGEYMGERYITASFSSSVPIDFALGDYVVYRGETYVLNVIPAVTRNSRNGTNGESLKYDSVKFNSASDELTRCMFLDSVTDDNQMHYFALPNFSFYATNVKSLCERIQANLDRMYGDGIWSFAYGDISEGYTDVSISVDNKTCWEALAMVNSDFGLGFTIKGRTITIGYVTSNVITTNYNENASLEYGKDKGLLNIEKNSDSSQNVITRLRIYGNTTNMPTRYYQTKGQWSVTIKEAIINGTGWMSLKLSLDYSSEYFTSTTIVFYINGKSFTGKWVDESPIYDGYYIMVNSTDSRLKQGASIERISSGIDITKLPDGVYTENIPSNLAANRLMLPGYPIKSLNDYVDGTETDHYYSETKTDPYIDSKNKDSIGIREYTVYADGSNEDLDDIYPTIENMNADELIAAGYDLADGTTGRLDKVVSAQQIRDDGIYDGTTKLSYESSPEGTITPFYNEIYAGITFNIPEAGKYKIKIYDDFVTFKSSKGDIGAYVATEIATTEEGSETTNTSLTTTEATITTSGTSLGSGSYTVSVDAPALVTITFSISSYTSIQEGDAATIVDGGTDAVDVTYAKYFDGDSFTITLKDIGFDISDYVSDETPVISMKSGKCIGREFDINKVEYTDGRYVLTCSRAEDTSLNMYFPNKSYNIATDDEFVLTGIYMPNVYVEAASQRLLLAGQLYIDANDDTAYSYTPKIDNIFVQRERDWAESQETESIYDKIYEGMRLPFKDEGLGIDESIIIDKLSIKEGYSIISQLSVTLRDKKEASTIKKIMNKLDKVGSGSYSEAVAEAKKAASKTSVSLVTTNNGLEHTDENAYSALHADGTFLRKDQDDVTAHNLEVASLTAHSLTSDGDTNLNGTTTLTSVNYEQGTSGAAFYNNNGEAVGEVDTLYVHHKLSVKEAEIQEVNYIGGTLVLTPANGFQIQAVDNTTSDYTLYWLAKDADGKSVYQTWNVGDLALCQMFGTENNSLVPIGEGVDASGNKLNQSFWWRRVTAVSSEATKLPTSIDPNGADPYYYNWVRVSSSNYASGSDAPSVGQNVVMLGHIDETGTDGSTLTDDCKVRQSAILITVVDGSKPAVKIYEGINSYSLEGCCNTQLQPGNNILKGEVQITSGSIPDGTSTYDIKNLPDNIREALTNANSALAALNSMKSANSNLLRNSGFGGEHVGITVSEQSTMSEDDETFSPSLTHWDADSVSVYKASEINPVFTSSESGCVAQMASGTLKQDLYFQIVDSDYVLSFYAALPVGTETTQLITASIIKGSTETKIGEFTLAAGTHTWSRYNVSFSPSSLGIIGGTQVKISGTCFITQLQLEKGTAATDWNLSVLDNGTDMAYYQQLLYLSECLQQRSAISGGLVMSSMIELGSSTETDETADDYWTKWTCKAGVNGIDYSDGDDNVDSPAFWGGGDLDSAIEAINFYKNDKSLIPTSAQLANQAKAVITHGGRAILQDVVLRGGIVSSSSTTGNRVEITPDGMGMKVYNQSGEQVAKYAGDTFPTDVTSAMKADGGMTETSISITGTGTLSNSATTLSLGSYTISNDHYVDGALHIGSVSLTPTEGATNPRVELKLQIGSASKTICAVWQFSGDTIYPQNADVGFTIKASSGTNSVSVIATAYGLSSWSISNVYMNSFKAIDGRFIMRQYADSFLLGRTKNDYFRVGYDDNGTTINAVNDNMQMKFDGTNGLQLKSNVGNMSTIPVNIAYGILYYSGTEEGGYYYVSLITGGDILTGSSITRNGEGNVTITMFSDIALGVENCMVSLLGYQTTTVKPSLYSFANNVMLIGMSDDNSENDCSCIIRLDYIRKTY